MIVRVVVKERNMATEKMDLALGGGPTVRNRKLVPKVMGRLQRLTLFAPSDRLDVLEIGSAQGRGLIALSRLGHRATGVR